MVKATSGGRSAPRRGRQKYAEGEAEHLATPSVGDFFSGRFLCRFCAVAAGLTWAALLVLTGQQFLSQDEAGHPLASGSSKEVNDRIRALEAENENLRQANVVKDQELERKSRLLAVVEQKISDKHPSWSAEQFEDLAGASGVQTTTVPPNLRGAGVKFDSLMPLGKCDFVDDLDYQLSGSGREDMVKQRTTADDCCEVCTKKNLERKGSCMVAIFSSPQDSPPSACWIKGFGQPVLSLSTAVTAVIKPGVKACWPPGHGEIPKVAGPSQGDLEHNSRLNSLQSAMTPSVDRQTIRANAVRDAIKHAWSGYKRLAWGQDEVMPIAGRGRNKGFNHAVTMVDALDTLWIAGLKTEFNEAKDWIVNNLPNKVGGLSGQISVFETTIRTLGGLLSAYDLSGEKPLLDVAVKLGRRILNVVNDKGITPYTFGGGRGGMGCNSLAESGTIQLEMRYLSHVTGDPSFEQKVMKFYETLRGGHASFDGLYPNCYAAGKGKITFGADGDSFYEYLVKVFVQGGRREEEHFLWDMYDQAVDGMEKHMTTVGSDGLTYLGIYNYDGKGGGSLLQEMEHLTCFVPGWLALGAQTPQGEAKRSQRMKLAESIATTCYKMYESQPTGIGPERVKGMMMDLSKTNTKEYILRPEAVEGWWYMFEFTKEDKYREWGWKTFLAIEQWLWVPNGYASLKDVSRRSKMYIDRMESFFLAETLKYLLLLQDPDHTIKLDRYVFNTEAHPLSMLEFAPKP